MSRPPDEHGARGPRPRPGYGPPRTPPPRLICVLGPTGSGKSALAVALARRLDGEVVGCDALQVYRGFDAATAKPTSAERASVPHHLVDEVDPRTDFSLAEFVRRAEARIEAIQGRGRVPIIAGGTGLYLRGLLRGVVAAPPRDERLRARLQAVALRRGGETLHRWLAVRDPASARRLGARDVQRVVRALEVALRDSRTWSEHLDAAGSWAGREERFAATKIGLGMPRESLYQRLDRRVLGFFAAGLVDEVRGLLASGVPATANAFKAIGYRQVLAALTEGRDPDATVAEVQQATRRYAKRQLTWFRSEPGVSWLEASLPPESLLAHALAVVRAAARAE